MRFHNKIVFFFILFFYSRIYSKNNCQKTDPKTQESLFEYFFSEHLVKKTFWMVKILTNSLNLREFRRGDP